MALEDFFGSVVVESAAGSVAEFAGHLAECWVPDLGEVGSPGEVLSHEAVGVLPLAPLPCGACVGEVYLRPVLPAAVEGQRPPRRKKPFQYPRGGGRAIAARD